MPLTNGAVEELAKLLAEEARVDDKIRDTRAALKLVKKRISESLVEQYVAKREPKVEMPEDLMKEEQSYERLLQALQDMKSEIARQIRPVEEQIVQASVEHLRQSFDQENRRLAKCLEQIDQNILGCRQALDEYEQLRSGLHGLNEKLAQLGAERLQVPDSMDAGDLEGIIRARIESLRSQGRI